MARFPPTGKAGLAQSFPVSPSHSTAPRAPCQGSHPGGNLGCKDGPGTVLAQGDGSLERTGEDPGTLPLRPTEPPPSARGPHSLDVAPLAEGPTQDRRPSSLSPPSATPPARLRRMGGDDRCVVGRAPDSCTFLPACREHLPCARQVPGCEGHPREVTRVPLASGTSW